MISDQDVDRAIQFLRHTGLDPGMDAARMLAATVFVVWAKALVSPAIAQNQAEQIIRDAQKGDHPE